MSYLKVLIKDKENREKYEQQRLELKYIVMDIETIYNKYDGEYLEKLKKFNEEWKNKTN